jgi:hypothetical protein
VGVSAGGCIGIGLAGVSVKMEPGVGVHVDSIPSALLQAATNEMISMNNKRFRIVYIKFPYKLQISFWEFGFAGPNRNHKPLPPILHMALYSLTNLHGFHN